MKRVFSVLCEGPHDVMFLYRILMSIGFTSYNSTKINSFPKPINDFLLKQAKKSNLEDINIKEVRNIIFPITSMIKNNNIFLLYSLGGDGKKDLRLSLLKDFYDFVPKENEIEVLQNDTDLGVIYFLDSDNIGLEKRIEEINSEVNTILNSKPFSLENKIVEIEKLILGLYIFTGKDNDKGKLENILLPLMKKDNESIFESSKKFLEENHEVERCKSKFDDLKSIIGTAGQLQISGTSNTVCIEKSDYLTNEKILDNEKCKEIIAFFEKLIN